MWCYQLVIDECYSSVSLDECVDGPLHNFYVHTYMGRQLENINAAALFRKGVADLTLKLLICKIFFAIWSVDELYQVFLLDLPNDVHDIALV